MLEHRRFRFFPCLREQLQPGKQSSARSPSSPRLYVGKRNKLFLVLFRIFLTAFPFEKDGCQHSSSSPFFAGNHEYTFEDWRERTKKITGLAKTRSLSRKSPVFFIRISFSYNVSYFFPFQFEIEQCAILLPWKLFLSNESSSFCTRLFLFRFINRNRNTAQKEYTLRYDSRTWAGIRQIFRQKWNLYRIKSAMCNMPSWLGTSVFHRGLCDVFFFFFFFFTFQSLSPSFFNKSLSLLQTWLSVF